MAWRDSGRSFEALEATDTVDNQVPRKKKKLKPGRPRLRAAWVLISIPRRNPAQREIFKILTLGEFLYLGEMCRVHGVTRDLQKMVHWHEKHVGLAERKKLTEKELDRIAKSLARESRDEYREKEIEQVVQDITRGIL